MKVEIVSSCDVNTYVMYRYQKISLLYTEAEISTPLFVACRTLGVTMRVSPPFWISFLINSSYVNALFNFMMELEHITRLDTLFRPFSEYDVMK